MNNQNQRKTKHENNLFTGIASFIMDFLYFGIGEYVLHFKEAKLYFIIWWKQFNYLFQCFNQCMSFSTNINMLILLIGHIQIILRFYIIYGLTLRENIYIIVISEHVCTFESKLQTCSEMPLSVVPMGVMCLYWWTHAYYIYWFWHSLASV